MGLVWAIVGALLAIASLAGTVMIGSLGLRAAQSLEALGKRRGLDRSDHVDFERLPAFAPLDIGPDRMKWPSQMQRPRSGRPLPPWPSANWDDPQFGRAAPPELGDLDDAPMRSRIEAAADASRPATQKAKKKPKKPKAAAPQPRQPQRHEPAQPQPQAAVPNPEEVRAMVQNLGLAASVEEIRRRTGWDFKQAAQYLARVMRNP